MPYAGSFDFSGQMGVEKDFSLKVPRPMSLAGDFDRSFSARVPVMVRPYLIFLVTFSEGLGGV